MAMDHQSSREVPYSLIRKIRSFPEPHDRYFQLAVSNPAWRSLAESDSVLAWVVAHSEELAGIPASQLLAAGCKEQMCASAGFPGSVQTVRLLRRLSIGAEQAMFGILLLRELLRHEPAAFDVLEASSEVNAQDLTHLAVGNESFDGWGNLRELGWFFPLPAAVRHLIGRLYAAAVPCDNKCVAALIGPVKLLSGFNNKDEAIDWLKEYAGWKDKIELAELDDESSDWPDPPIPGTGTIIPIRSSGELCPEFQRLWLNLDTHRVVSGDYYFYRLVAGQTCLLGIAFVSGSWVIDDLLGSDGSILQDVQIRSEVENWLILAKESSRDINCRQAVWRLHLSRVAAKAGLPAGAPAGS